MCLGTAGQVIDVRETAGLVMVEVDFPNGPRRTALSYVEDIQVGDFVLVSGNAVIERVSEEEAEERASFATIMLAAFDATHTGGSTP